MWLILEYNTILCFPAMGAFLHWCRTVLAKWCLHIMNKKLLKETREHHAPIGRSQVV